VIAPVAAVFGINRTSNAAEIV